MYGKTTELKVGIFVVMALVGIGILTVKVAGEAVFGRKTYELRAVFENVSGLVIGARVEMAGVVVGKVKRIELLPEGKVRVDLAIYEGIKVTEDAEAWIKTAGVLGERYVEIRQGKKRTFLKPGDFIAKTESPLEVRELLAEIGPLVRDFRKVAEGLNAVLGDEEVQRNIKSLIANLEETSETFKDIGKRIAQGKGTLGKLLYDERLYQDIKHGFSDFRVTMAELKEVSKNMREGKGTLGKLLTDEEVYMSFREAMKSVEKSSKIVASFVERVNRGEGLLGKLLMDETLYQEFKKGVTSFNNIVRRLEVGEGTLGKLLTDESLYFETKRVLQNVNRASIGLQEQIPISILGTIAGAAMQ